MPTYLKKADKSATTGEQDVRATVQGMLDEIEAEGDAKAAAYAEKFDKWDGDIVVSDEARAAAAGQVSQKLKDDIAFAHENVRLFAEAQMTSVSDVEIELKPGLIAGTETHPGRHGGLLRAGGALRAYRLGDHDRDDSKGRRRQTCQRLFTTSARRRNEPRRSLCTGYLRGGYNSQSGGCTGDRRHGFWAFRYAKSAGAGRSG